ncbi:MAG: AraC family transcriptional regulator [Acidobacteriota bacterium]|nr:AraC family transcriptional regulator [Acidobacteriota bacterium]
MAIVLGSGEFFGRVVTAAQWEPFRMSETRYARGALLPWHRHDESYLTFVLAGGYRERSVRQTQSCAARSMVLHPAGETHEDDFSEQPARCLNVVLAPSFTARLGAAAVPLERGGMVEGAQVASIGARLAAELRRSDAASQLMVEGLLLELFGTLARSASGSRAPSWLDEADAILQRRFTEKLSLGGLAEMVGVHPVHLARAFRKRYGVSVGERVRALRLELAREQVLAGVPLAEVATQAGFADQSHLTRSFTRAYGVAPAEYRRVQGCFAATRSRRAPGRTLRG